MATAPQQFANTSPSRIILFGGQGSSSLFSTNASSIAKHDANSSPAGAIILSRCHAAFLEDYQDLDQDAKDGLGIDISKFRRPEDLLIHDGPLRFHGLTQATTIFIYQLLHYLAEIEQSDDDFGTFTESIMETTGFCSGLLGAAVVATSANLSEFIDHGVKAFRLAFYIACRTLLEGQKIHATRDEEPSWSLVIVGLSLQDVRETLEKFSTENDLHTVRVSALSSAKMISLSGPGPHLSMVSKSLESAPVKKFAHVHGWYHAGEQLQNAVEKVLRDVKRRDINFPSLKDLKRPIRSTNDGHLLNDRSLYNTTFAEWITRHLLIYPVDWITTSRRLSKNVMDFLEGDKTPKVEVSSFGPSTETIFTEIRAQLSHPRLIFSDRSPFKATENTNASVSTPGDIAIVGMGVNFPCGNNQSQLWETLSNGLNAVSEIPESRFKVSQYYAADTSQETRKMPVQEGAFLEDVWGFDNSFFNISPREAKSMDPQQRIILSTTQAALEDAGYVSDATPSFRRASIGCYIGIATGDYTDNLRNDIDVFYSPGTLRAFHSGRISYVYKLSGPCMTIDTACSSSLVSIYQACRALQSNDCTAAIAGGANVITSPDMYLGLSRGHFLSKKGGCKPFDEAADGYGRAEGCGVFILKRLEDAITENDRIHGVIKSVEANQSGNSHSITHPHSETQTQLFKQVLAKSSIDPKSISVVEAHGTGTQESFGLSLHLLAGDTREIASLRAVFETAHSSANPLIVSSIKGNIGHCGAASGAAGLAKLLLMLRKREIPMQANLNSLNNQLGDLTNAAAIKIPRKLQPWESQNRQPRRALLNNFGAAGSNTALLLEEWLGHSTPYMKLEDRSAYIFNLSAKSKDALRLSIQNQQRFLNEAPPHLGLKDICYTATARRQIYNHRISITCSSVHELKTKLADVELKDCQLSRNEKSVVFVFSGQGSLYTGMGMELFKSSSLFRSSILYSDRLLRNWGFSGILDFICGEDSVSLPVSSKEIIASQCACVALEYAVAQVFLSVNITPSCLTGHSLGEYAALAVSGALTIEDSLWVVANRAKLMVENCAPHASGMVACKSSPSKIDSLLAKKDKFSEISVACRNTDDGCVVAGSIPELESFQEECSNLGIKTKKLDVPYGFHSASMDPIVEPLKELGKTIQWSIPLIPIASNVTGCLLTREDFQTDYFASHARQPVLFSDTIRRLSDQGILTDATCLEIGPHPTTLPMIRSVLGSSCSLLPTLQRDKDPWVTLGMVLGSLFKILDGIDWRKLFERDVTLVDLPGHPLMNTNFSVPYQESDSISSGPAQNPDAYTATGFSLLPRLITARSSSTEESMRFETTMEILGPLISGHSVGGTAICPASVYHELALEAAQIATPPSEEKLLTVRDMSFTHPLILDPKDSSNVVQVIWMKIKADDASIDPSEAKVMISILRDDQEFLCCTTFVSKKAPSAVKRSLLRAAPMVDRQSQYILNEHNTHNTFHTKLLYETIFARVVKYSAEYQSLTKLSLSGSNYEAVGSFKLPSGACEEIYVTPPVFIDTLLHTAGFAANLSVRPDEICICGHVESIETLQRVDYGDTFTVYCTLVDMDGSIILADSYALNSRRQAVAIIRGMEFKRLRLSSFQRMLQQATAPIDVAKESSDSPPELSYSNSDSPDSSSTRSGSPEPVENDRQGIQDIMMGTISEVYGSQDLDRTRSMDALGIDSLMQIEIAAKLSKAFPGKGIVQGDLLNCETLQRLEDLLFLKTQADLLNNASRGPTSREQQPEIISVDHDHEKPHGNPIRLFVANSSSVPLVLIHDGSGQGSTYSRIRDLDRDIFAFHDPHFPQPGSIVKSLEQMAEQYVSCLSQPRTPSLIVGGWSFGGVVAFQAAQLLAKMGFKVRGLLLIDSPYPRNHEPLPEAVVSYILGSSISNKDPQSSNVVSEFMQNATLLAKYQPVDFNGGEHAKIKTVYLQSQDTFDTQASCGVSYEWLSSQRVRDAAVHSWEGLVGDHIRVFPIPGNHFQAFAPENIAETSRQLKSACHFLEDTQ